MRQGFYTIVPQEFQVVIGRSMRIIRTSKLRIRFLRHQGLPSARTQPMQSFRRIVIPMADILEWRATHPWQTLAQVEQDLLLSRCIVAMFSRDDIAQRLAMRGGTVLHKLYCAPARRYPEDIDLVQMHAGPICLAWCN